jgi:peptide/nickel transport system ATP-binding protein
MPTEDAIIMQDAYGRSDSLGPPADAPLLSVQDLHVRFGRDHTGGCAVSGVSFDIPVGRTVGVVGESGSGKSVTSLAITKLFPKSSAVDLRGKVMFNGRDLTALTEHELRSIRGKGISYVFQDPLSALDPVRRCGEQVAEVIRIHEPTAERGEIRARILDLFERLGLPHAGETARKYPHELSGGMRQRVMIAMALACRPALLIADEPTTALDVIVQKQIVDLLQRAVSEFQTSILFISHDLALVSSIADEVVVMRDGQIVEAGATAAVSRDPQHPYTQKLWSATPTLHGTVRPSLETRRPAPLQPSELLQVDGITHSFSTRQRGKGVAPQVLADISLSAREGETVCVVGESGSGKSTLARCVAGLITPTSGNIRFAGKELVGADHNTWRTVRRDIQMVFQDPYASLNPRMRVVDLVGEGFVINKLLASKSEVKRRSTELLEMVGLQAEHGDRYPHQFSGGQRQRIAIARALALRPRLLICDEPVTSLDVSVRAQVVQLLVDIQNQHGVTYLFITHDIALAREIADRVVVMHQGQVVEAGAVRDVIDAPTDDYTRALRAAVPNLPS